MPLTSSKVAAGTEILADHFNKLREDLLTNHDHSAGHGGTIDHKDLAETDEMAGMTHQHNDLEVHLQGGGPGPNAIDNPGADQGVHGLPSAAYVAGTIDQNGTPTQLVIRCGSGTLSNGASAFFDVTLSPAFGQIYGIYCTYVNQPDGGMDQDSCFVRDVTPSGFRVQAASPGIWGGHLVYWMAIGTLT